MVEGVANLDWAFSITTWLALLGLGVALLTLPRHPPFWIARVCFIASALVLLVNSVWWAMNTNYPFGLRALIVGGVSALAMIALAESFRWAWHAEAAEKPSTPPASHYNPQPGAPMNSSNGQSGGQSGHIENKGPVFNGPVTFSVPTAPAHPPVPQHKPHHADASLIPSEGAIYQAGAVVGEAFGARRSPTDATMFEFVELTHAEQFNRDAEFQYAGYTLSIRDIRRMFQVNSLRPRDGTIYEMVTAAVLKTP